MGERAQTIEEGDQFLPSALGAQGQGDGGQASDCIETEDNVVVLRIGLVGWESVDGQHAGGVRAAAYLELVDEHGDGVELIVRIRRVSHDERFRQ